MKIAIDARLIGNSGIGTYIENIVPMLVNRHKQHHYLLIGHESQIGLYRGISNVELLLTDISQFSLKECVAFPVEEINKCDAFYCPYINVPGGIRVPVYSTIHDVIFLDIKGLSSRLGTLLRWAFYKRAIYLSEALFTVSEFSATRIRNHFNTKKDIHVTFSAISKQIKEYIPKKERVYDFLYYVYIGNIKKHKGIDILIKAINESNERGFDIKLVVVGDYKKIKTKDKNVMNLLNSANNNVLFTGFVPNDKLYDILSQSLALILPTHYEGFGLPPLESLYLGGNAIITDLLVLREVYSELPVSFFKEGDVNALAELLMLKLQLNTDVPKTRQYIDCHYNFEIIADKIIQVIENHHVS